MARATGVLPRRRRPGRRHALRGGRRRAGVQALATAREARRRARARRRGRASALVDGGASLLAVGIARWDGDFRAGDGVELVGPDGVAFARGIASVDSAELDGRPANVEAVHRDRLDVFSR